ncbi:MAG: hypothetical protein C0603_10900 [Denitrovibrio sp.]|nr:MAG: hypothetical protein C0603_10900 [Denitrovibrio sp.]
MEVILINAAVETDANSSFIAERLQAKYEGCKRFDLCNLEMDPTYGFRKDDSGFKPDMVEDGLREVMGAVKDADLIILVSPNYFSFISGVAKLFLDKFYVFQNFSGRPTFGNDKKFFFVLTQASPNRSHGQSTLDWMKNFAGMFDMKFFGFVVPSCKGKEPSGAKVKIDEISMSLNMFV